MLIVESGKFSIRLLEIWSCFVLILLFIVESCLSLIVSIFSASTILMILIIKWWIIVLSILIKFNILIKYYAKFKNCVCSIIWWIICKAKFLPFLVPFSVSIVFYMSQITYFLFVFSINVSGSFILVSVVSLMLIFIKFACVYIPSGYVFHGFHIFIQRLVQNILHLDCKRALLAINLL